MAIRIPGTSLTRLVQIVRESLDNIQKNTHGANACGDFAEWSAGGTFLEILWDDDGAGSPFGGNPNNLD